MKKISFNILIINLLKIILVINIIFLLPSCLEIALQKYYDHRFPHVRSQIEATDDKINYCKIAADWGKKNGYNTGLPPLFGNWESARLLKAEEGGGIEIWVHKANDSKVLTIDVQYGNYKMDKKDIISKTNNIMNEFKQKYMAEIDRIKNIDK